ARCPSLVSRFQQEAEVAAIRAEFPAYAALHSPVVQEVLARLDTTSPAVLPRIERAGRGREAGRVPTLHGPDSLSLLHVQSVWQQGPPRERVPGAVQVWAPRPAVESPTAGHAQDRHQHKRGAWLGWGDLLC